MILHRNCYTYLIGWSKEKKFYYGRRTRVGCDPSDLWVKYFTSSVHVQRFAEIHGSPDVIQVRKIFGIDIKRCELWEEKVLRRLDAENHQFLLNRRNLQAALSTSGVAPAYDIESNYIGLISVTDDKWGTLIFGANKFKDTSYLSDLNKKMVENGTHSFLGDKNPSRKKVKNGTHHFLKNSPMRATFDRFQRTLVDDGLHHWLSEDHKEQTRKRTRLAIANGTHPTVIMLSCVSCRKTGQKSAMNRWHLENCKSMKK